ncbi:hypothetical protein Barb4_04866 [Bacteroidales bacterium Barb4]|nr:hypothetical protein Barb4_04866 [Bacteroidales bacterium Barb4]
MIVERGREGKRKRDVSRRPVLTTILFIYSKRLTLALTGFRTLLGLIVCLSNDKLRNRLTGIQDIEARSQSNSLLHFTA